MRINTRRYTIPAYHLSFSSKIQHCKKLFQGGIDPTLVGPTDIGISEKSAKTITKTGTKESGLQGGAIWPPQTQAGSE